MNKGPVVEREQGELGEVLQGQSTDLVGGGQSSGEIAIGEL